MKKVLVVSKSHPEPASDLKYWLSRPSSERLAAMTRMNRLAWRAAGRKFPKRIARVVRVLPGHG